MKAGIYNMDCMEAMGQMSDNSIDSIVTDPPYGLEFMGKEWDAPWKGKAGKSFNESCAGKLGGFKKLPNYTRGNNVKCLNCDKWRFSSNPCNCDNPKFPNTRHLAMIEYQKWFSPICKEMLRVLKPGGILLCFGGTRTTHRITCAIEDAGFEIRDMIAWVYGSGFPKSHNISKSIDKMKGKTPIPVMVKEITDADLFNKRSEKKMVMKKTSGIGSGKTFAFTDGNNKADKEIDITTPATPEAEQWDGWGTSLKPALEPITVARKPLSEKTIAANVLKWGTGGINIDGCRIEGKAKKWSKPKGGIWNPSEDNGAKLEENSQGRFPANFIHDGSQMVLDLFPDTKSGYNLKHYGNKRDGKAESVMKNFEMRDGGFGDSGSAARFFYCAKASKADRNEGLDGLEEKQYSHDGRNKEIKNAFQRNKSIAKNNHPTVKPTKLMQYLVRLVTPPNGTVLDPFMGSGSTGKACKLEGFNFVGIELDSEYFKIAKQRLNIVKRQMGKIDWE
ncbi:hypothetical protein LCGC14_1037600 [marine sediment metagenome]|uniref:DNA methylase N-4/N-6 domain-containing protein n=1 Tax=marine sediment metagenome TaxID=412755 RepID=A0A0F9NED0_9ZZZZ